MKLIRTRAFVLRKITLLGRDKIINLFTEDKGKLSIVAKGIKKITSKRSPHLETGNLIRVIIHQNKDRYYLAETSLISGFTDIKKQKAIINWYQALFILDRILPLNQPELPVFNLFIKYLTSWSQKEVKINNNTNFYNFLNQLLKILGYSEKVIPDNQITSTVEEIINEKIPSFSI